MNRQKRKKKKLFSVAYGSQQLTKVTNGLISIGVKYVVELADYETNSGDRKQYNIYIFE